MDVGKPNKSDFIGGFKRLALIGSGAQGKVWKAECVEDVHGIVPVGTVVALKVRYEHGDNLDAQWQKTAARVAELKVMDHPNVVRYLGCFREKALDQEKHIVVQEFLEGETLKERLDALNRWNPGRNRLGLDVDAAIDIVSQVAAGLGYTAGLDIFHRDVKPGNVFLCRDGKVKLIDFGVARQSDGTITEEGNIRGSWNYLAPDFADGVFRGDQQSDIFSVGVVLHEIITGRLPYQDAGGDDMAAYFARWAKTADAVPIRIVSNTKRLLLGVDTIFDRTLTPDRDGRYRDFAQLQKALAGVRFVEQKHAGKTYRRVQFVGEGGFGEVFKARWLERNVPVAVKMLKNADGAARFHAEAEVMKELDDPCFTRFVDFFEEDGRAFLVMTFLEGMPGSSLRDAINRSKIEARMKGGPLTGGGLPKDLVLSAFERYARGLGLMHGHHPPIVHRDIKPTNLYFPAGHPERVAIMDFGIVRTGDSSTASGITPCTFDYAPPEIATTADRGGPGMDVFALGLCMYEALTGKMGYPRITGGQAGLIHFFERCKLAKPPVFDDPRVTEDSELLRLLRRMTDPDVGRRLSDADAVAVEIRKLFYRDVEGDTSDTVFFDPNTDRTVAINDDRLKAWFEAWKKSNPVDEKRLMEIYREQWLKEHDGGESSSVRELPKRSRWLTFLFVPSFLALTSVGGFFAWPYLERFMQPKEPAVKVDKSELLEAKRIKFEKEFDDLLTVDPIETRRSRLREAESKLAAVVGTVADVDAGCLYAASSESARRFNDRLSKLKRAVIGIVGNKCDFRIEVGGKTIYGGETEQVEFAEGDPASHRIVAAGYESKNVPGDFDGRTLILTREDFIPADVRVELPSDMGDAVTCLFEGKAVRGPLRLKPRPTPYGCVFQRRGYEDKIRSFKVELGRNMRLSGLGSWTPSSVRVTVGALDGGVTCTMDGNPMTNAVSVVPGEHLVKYSRRGYEDLETRIKVAVGVARKIPVPSEIGIWKMLPVRVAIPALDAGVRCYVDGREELRRACDLLPGEHVCRYERDGYVPQSNRTFVVALASPTNLPAPGQWALEKVNVTIPPLTNTQARLDGKIVSGTLPLVPDRTYQVEYVETPSSRRQTVFFYVRINTPMTAPKPDADKWIDPRPVPSAPTLSKPSPPKPAPPRPVSSGPKPLPAVGSVSEQARKAYREAVDYYELEEHDKAFEWYHQAFEAGYPLNAQDFENARQAYKKAYAVLSGRIEEWERRPKHTDSHRKIEDLIRQRSDIIKKHRAMQSR